MCFAGCGRRSEMRAVITGASGFIGRALCERLRGDYEIVALSRNAEQAAKSPAGAARVVTWDGRTLGDWIREVDGAAAVVNLAGENVASGRWTTSKKERILRSRIDCTRALVEAIKRVDNRPGVMIQASAVGYYGARGDELLDEGSSEGSSFLVEVCRESEGVGGEVETLGVRYVVVRTGVVLGAGGGALAKMMQPFRFYLGGHLGSGRQWLSWISLDDEVAAIEFLIKNRQLKGAFNLTSPQPVTMREFSRTLGRVLGRPAWVNVPGFVIRLLLGEMANEMLLRGQRVMPRRLREAGFEFKYEDLERAMTAILKGKQK
jgi:uncharacterized protein (TIGR01777 family)